MYEIDSTYMNEKQINTLFLHRKHVSLSSEAHFSNFTNINLEKNSNISLYYICNFFNKTPYIDIVESLDNDVAYI